MQSRARKVRTLLSGGVAREDSDDELGLEDHPWQWVYAERQSTNGKAQILGAKMGSFSCRIGDTVLLKADGTNEAWVGLIYEFIQGGAEGQDQDQKEAKFLWFASEKEIRNRQKKRTDWLEVLPRKMAPNLADGLLSE